MAAHNTPLTSTNTTINPLTSTNAPQGVGGDPK
jgi:hypothetical protein